MCTSRFPRYISTLTLVRIRLEQRGYYTVYVSNGDDSKKMTFDLVVKGKKVGHPSEILNSCLYKAEAIYFIF